MRLLPTKHLVPMLVAGLVFQATASGRFAFAAAAWMCLVSLATLARTASLPLFLTTSFAVIWLGRLVGWHGQLTVDGVVVSGSGVVVAAAVAAGLTVLCLLAHRLAMREFPTWGLQVLPSAVVVVEGLAAHFQLLGASLLPLSTAQPGDVPFWNLVPFISPLGISFAVAWTQAVMAGYGEAWLAEDPHPQRVRERGQRIGSNLVFWLVLVVGHMASFIFSDDVDAAGLAAGVAKNEFVFRACAVYLVVVLAASVVARLRRPPQKPGSPT